MRRATVNNPCPPRLFWLGTAALALFASVQVLSVLEPFVVRLTAEPRAVTPRRDLAPEEQTNIEIFRRASPSVVFITTTEPVLNPWTRNVPEVPRGTGSSFVRDNHGHVVTNFHVIAGAQAAQVRLSDHRMYPAALVGASRAGRTTSRCCAVAAPSCCKRSSSVVQADSPGRQLESAPVTQTC